MDKLIVAENPLPDVYLLDLPNHVDNRGIFVKTFNKHLFQGLNLEFEVHEAFYSCSAKNVLRGMHFQSGDSSHSKLVYCLSGSLLDVVVGIDPDQQTFNRCYSVQLDACRNQALLIGNAYAHGFLSLTDNTIVGYMTSTVNNPQADKGVLWSTISFDWPIIDPVISERDGHHPPIQSLA